MDRRTLLRGAASAAGLTGMAALGGCGIIGRLMPGGASTAQIEPTEQSLRAALTAAQQTHGGRFDFAYIAVSQNRVFAMSPAGQTCSAGPQANPQETGPSVSRKQTYSIQLDKIPFNHLATAAGSEAGWSAALVTLPSGSMVVSGTRSVIAGNREFRFPTGFLSRDSFAHLWTEAQLMNHGRLSGMQVQATQAQINIDTEVTCTQSVEPDRKAPGGVCTVSEQIMLPGSIHPGSVTTNVSGAHAAARIDWALSYAKASWSAISKIELTTLRNASAGISDAPGFAITGPGLRQQLGVFVDDSLNRKVRFG